MGKYFIFALLVFIAHQGLIDAKHVAIEKETRNLWEDALQALKELKENLIKLVKDTVQELRNILEGFKEQAEQILQEAKDLIHEEILKIIEEIERIKEEAEALGVDIAECLEDQKQQVEALEERIILELVACVTNKIHEAEQIVTDTIAEIQDVLKSYQELEEKLAACQEETRDLSCITAVLKEVAEKTIHLPKLVREQIVKAKKLIANLRKDLKKCAFEKVTIVREEGAIIVANFTQCVRDKIDGVSGEPLNALEDALQALQALKENLENLIQETEEKLQAIVEQFRQEAADILEQAKQEVHEEIIKILESIQKVKDEAEAIGLDISECLQEQQEKVKELEKRLIRELVKCVTDKVEEAVEIVVDTVSAVKDTLQAYKELKGKLEACKSNEKDLKCVANVLKEIVDKSISLPVTIAKQVAKAEKLIKNLKADLIECALEKVLIIKDEGGKIVQELVECIRDKLRPNDDILLN